MSPAEIEVQKSLSFGLQIKKKKRLWINLVMGPQGFILLQNSASAHLGQKRQCSVLKNTNEVLNKLA